MISTKRQELSNSCAESAETIGNNEDILINILVHLPGKSLSRFRLVSKRWLSVISSPYFISCFNESSKLPSALFLRPRFSSNKTKYHPLSLDGKPVSQPFTSHSFADESAGIRILQSCNGLLLCRCSNRRNYYIYNPTTNRYTTLPKPSNRIPNTVFGVILAFDPLKSSHYKVVYVRSSVSCLHLYQLEIYSSETQLWSLSSEIPKFNYTQGVYCSGFIHWMSDSGTGASLCFDVDEERFRTIPMPEIPEGWGKQAINRYFGESGGRLHLILTNGKHCVRKFDVYEMEKDISRWFVKYQVDLNALISAYPEMTCSSSYSQSHWDYHTFQVLAVVCEEQETEQGSFMVLHIPGKVISYRFKDKSSTLLHDFAPGSTDIEGCTTPYYAYPYIPSLASV